MIKQKQNYIARVLNVLCNVKHRIVGGIVLDRSEQSPVTTNMNMA